MGQSLSASSCCSCLLDCWNPQRRKYIDGKPTKSSSISPVSTEHADVQQPLVVEDESWKKWSSYNLIHDKSNASAGASQSYHPPVYVSQTHQQDAEAVWDL